MKLYSKTFTPEEVEVFKALTEAKNAPYGWDNVGVASKNKWIGTPCEITFKEYMEKRKIANTYHVNNKDIDEIDFTVYWLKIDVKGSSTRGAIGEDYACWVSETQYEKMTRAGYPVNTLVFCAYNLSTNTAYLMGYLLKKDFMVKATQWKAGQVRCGYELRCNDYAVTKSQLAIFPELI